MKLINVQILRALAALAVVLYHTGVEASGVCKAVGLSCAYEFDFGFNGVVLFFMVSGFIMVVTSWNSFGKTGAVRTFIDKRLKRIVPLYWLVTTVAVVGIYFVPSMLNVPVLDVNYVISSYLFWPAERVNGQVRPIANLGWTLNLEMFFYAVFAIALFFGRLRGLIIAVTFLLCLTVLQMTGLFAAQGSLASVALNFWADPIIINFVIGIGIGVLYMLDVRITKTDCLLLAGIAIASAAAFNYNYELLGSFREDHVIARLVSALPVLPVFIIGALGPQIDVNKIWTKIGLLLGDASYSLYLVHPFAIRPFRAIWSKFVGDALPIWCFMIACFALAVLVGLLSYYLAERPLTNYFNRRKPEKASANALGNPVASA
jgi:exopolysaccharide production protein ExoZ